MTSVAEARLRGYAVPKRIASCPCCRKEICRTHVEPFYQSAPSMFTAMAKQLLDQRKSAGGALDSFDMLVIHMAARRTQGTTAGPAEDARMFAVARDEMQTLDGWDDSDRRACLRALDAFQRRAGGAFEMLRSYGVFNC